MSLTGSFATDKAVIAASVFIVTFVGSCVPWILTGKCGRAPETETDPQTHQQLILSPRFQFILDALTCFSGGVIAAAAFVDVFPDALSSWHANAGKASIPSIITLLTFLFLWFVDRGFGHSHNEDINQVELLDSLNVQAPVSSHQQPEHTKSRRGVYILCAAMTFHSLCDGLAIGSEAEENQKFDELVIAILFHKGLDGVALGVPLFNAFGGQPLFSRVSLVPFCLFVCAALTAPIGLVIGMQWSSVPSLQSIFLSISCGSLLFISLIEMVPAALNKPENNSRLTFFFVFIGVCPVVLLSFFI